MWPAEVLPLVFGYSVAAGTGSLLAVPGSPFAVGNGPSSLVVDPSEHFLYVTNFIDNTVSGLKIDSTSGALTTALNSPFAAGTGPISVTASAESFVRDQPGLQQRLRLFD